MANLLSTQSKVAEGKDMSPWEEALESIAAFSDGIERFHGDTKQFLPITEKISSQILRAVGTVSGDHGSDSSPQAKVRQTELGIMEDVVSRFCWIFFEAAVDVKLVRKLNKCAVALKQHFPKMAVFIDCQFLVLLSENGGNMTGTQFSKVSNLLESGPLLQEPLATHFPSFLSAMSRTATSLVAEVLTAAPSVTLQPDVALRCAVLSKMALQMGKLVPRLLGEILGVDGGALGVSSGNDSRQPELASQLLGLIENLIVVMCSKKFSRESGMMAGSAVGMMLNSLSSPEGAVSMAMSLLSALHQEPSSVIADSRPNMGLFNRICLVPFQDFSTSEKAFGTLCLSRGMITCMDTRILMERLSAQNDPNEGQVFLLGPLLSVTQQLLGDPEIPEFHSIQLFTLWLQCVHRNLHALRSLLPSATQRFLSRSSEVVNLVLTCVWRHWHSPVEGVPELIRSLFGSLCESVKAENVALNSSDQELFQSLAADLLSSPIHLRGRYTLLSVLTPHLGAATLLRLHPSLPEELLMCLDTNHLVSAANENYKLLLQVLRSELLGERKAEERGQTSLGIWERHFHAVIVAGLSSDNALVRNNIANVWLPASFKIIPETFTILMEMGRGEDSEQEGDRGLHRKVILLKQARACKLIQGQEWMHQHRAVLEAAVNHHDDSIRGDTILLLCHSPKTSEPLISGEVSLIKTLVRNCLNSDNTSLRNQLRIGAKALVLRLRDSSLGWLKKIQPALGNASTSADRGVQELQPATKALHARIQGAMELLDWLLQECSSSLFPGACYQRKRASLDLLQLLYEHLSVGKETGMPGNAASSQKMLSWTQQLGKIHLYSERNASLLVNCLLDTSNDIRSSAYDLLIRYFPWPLPSSETHPWSSPAEILCQGMKLICSPKFHECEAGAMLCKLSFHRQMVESSQGIEDLVKPRKGAAAVSKVKKAANQSDPPIQFMVNFLKSLNYQFKCAKVNILRAAALTPMHGIILAVRKCLTEDSRIFQKVFVQDPEAWQTIVHEINSSLQKIINFVLDLLAGKLKMAELLERDKGCGLQNESGSGTSEGFDGGEALSGSFGAASAHPGSDCNGGSGGIKDSSMDTTPSPSDPATSPEPPTQQPPLSTQGGEDLQLISTSHGKMGAEIEKLVMDFGKGDGDGGAEEDVATLSLEYQLILSCCWLTLKESSLLMGALADVAPPFGNVEHRLLDKPQFELMSNSLVQILTKCRHKGALEGCRTGFHKVCAAMLACPDPDIATIPRALLDLVFAVITSDASSSYSKKSAGLPPLVESIIVAEPRGRERHLLKYTFTKLMEVAQRPLPTDIDAKQDLPQSHALNILQSLFVNSSLAWEVLPYAEEAVQVAIEGFSSSNWMVQNSSMQLLGALVARIFGQKKVQDEHSQVNTLSAAEFFQRFPRLRAYLLQEVSRAANLHRYGNGDGRAEESDKGEEEGGGGKGKLLIIPSLHPVLLVLTKLGTGHANEEQKRQLEEFVDPIRCLASSPIYSVRDLASRALIPLLSEKADIPSMASRLLDNFPSRSQPVITAQNQLHGDLLTIKKLLSTGLEMKSIREDQVAAITEKLAQSLWIGTSTNPCTITRSHFMELCTQWWEAAFGIKPDHMTSLMVKAKGVVEEFFSAVPIFQMGLSTLGQKMANSFLSMTKFIPGHVSDLSTLTQTLLTHDLPEVREVTLGHLQGIVTSSGADVSEVIRGNLWRQVSALLLVETSLGCLVRALDVWVGLTQGQGSRPEGDWGRLAGRLVAMTDLEGNEMSLCAAALPALSLALNRGLTDNESIDLETTSHWCDLVLKCSDPSRSETLRLAAAKALQNSGVHVLQKCVPEDVTHCDCAYMVMRAGMLLLQDEQPQVRDQAARFASVLPREGSFLHGNSVGHLHCSAGLELLLLHVCDKFCQNIDFLDTVISLLLGDAFLVQELIQEEIHNNSLNLFEQESINIYAEGAMEAKVVFQALKQALSALIETKPEVMGSWVEERWIILLHHVTNLVNFLGTHPVTANSFYAGTGHGKPYQALYRLLLTVRLLRETSTLLKPTTDIIQEASRQIADQFKAMQKMFYVFPLLKEAIPSSVVIEEAEESNEMD